MDNSKDFVPDAVMSTAFHAAIVATVKSVIPEGVLGLEAGRSATVAGRK